MSKRPARRCVHPGPVALALRRVATGVALLPPANRKRKGLIGSGVFDQRLTHFSQGHVRVISRRIVGLVRELRGPPVVELSAACRCSPRPHLVRERQGVEFGAGFSPRGEMLAEEFNKSFAVRRFDEMKHFVDDDVLKQIAGLLHQLGIQPDVSGAMVAAAPSGFHALEKHSLDLDAQLGFPIGRPGRSRRPAGALCATRRAPRPASRAFALLNPGTMM
jgi:hypothetical protein